MDPGIQDDLHEMVQPDDLHKCNFPIIPKLAEPVKSLLEISNAMDVSIIQSKLPPSKTSGHFGPWMPDDKWYPKKQRANRNYRKQVARLLLSKRNSSIEFSRNSSFYTDDVLETGTAVESSRDAMDPYFKKRPTGPHLKYTKSNTVVSELIPPIYHQTPSLPTLITLQSPANKNFHTAFSLGKVDYNDPEITSSVGVPLLLYSKGDSSRGAKSALEKSVNVNDEFPDSLTMTENRSRTSVGFRPQADAAGFVEGNFRGDTGVQHENKTSNRYDDVDNFSMIEHGTKNTSNASRSVKLDEAGTNTAANKLPRLAPSSTNTVTAPSSDRHANFTGDRFDMITSPPENPKILKILSQRKPSPPMCEFQDISLHIRHYRMYHTVRFTGRFSLANQPPPQEVKPVQWNEVFPHRPLSVNSTTAVPVFRLNVQDFSGKSNNQTTNNDSDKQDDHIANTNNINDNNTLSFTSTNIPIHKSTLEIPRVEDQKESELGQEEYKSYRRRSTPNYKDRSVTIDLTPTVTPVLKYKVKRGNDEGEVEGNGGYNQKEDTSLSTLLTAENATKAENDQNESKNRSENHNDNEVNKKTIQGKSSKHGRKSTKSLHDSIENVQIIGNINMKPTEELTDTPDKKSTQNQKMPSDDSRASKNSSEGERNTTKVLFSYREFLKRSNVSRDGLYTPRLRHDRASILSGQRSNDGDWRYPYSRKHAFISLLNSHQDSLGHDRRKIIIDEDQLKTSIEEKINDSNLRSNLKKRDLDESGDKFIKFMVKQDCVQEQHNAKKSEGDSKETMNSGACREEDGNSGPNVLGIVSTYDVNTYESDTEDIVDFTENDLTSGPKSKSSDDVRVAISSPTKKFWLPKNSRLSAKTRKINKSTEVMRQLVSNQTLPSTNNSPFVIAVPPPRKGFDDRSVVLPLQDFVHLAMKGSDQTFSKVSKSINSGCKLGISPNMTIGSASNRRSVDDGLVRVVSFASPVNQFIFAKRITGCSTASGGIPVSDGLFLDTEQKARSVFHGRTATGFRLRLKDFGVHRQKVDAGADNPHDFNQISKGNTKHNNLQSSASDKQEEMNTNKELTDTEDYKPKDSTEQANVKEKRCIDIYMPNEEENMFETSMLDITNEEHVTDSNNLQETGDDICGEGMPNTNVSRYYQAATVDRSGSAELRERSALRRRIVKLAEMRTSSEASDFDSMPYVFEGQTSLSTSFDIAQKAGTHGFKLIHSDGGGIKPGNSPRQLTDDVKDTLPHISNIKVSESESNEFSDLAMFANSKLSHETQNKLSQQPTRFQLRQKAKSKHRKKILNPNVIIRRDIKVETTHSLESSKQHASTPETKGPTVTTAQTKVGPIVPEGNPMMYSRIIRGSCLKKESASEEEEQRPKTVRFKCDGVEYRIVERIHDKK